MPSRAYGRESPLSVLVNKSLEEDWALKNRQKAWRDASAFTALPEDQSSVFVTHSAWLTVDYNSSSREI